MPKCQYTGTSNRYYLNDTTLYVALIRSYYSHFPPSLLHSFAPLCTEQFGSLHGVYIADSAGYACTERTERKKVAEGGVLITADEGFKIQMIRLTL